ncbi:MAG: flagellar protein FlaG [Pseudomonadota bacterium]
MSVSMPTTVAGGQSQAAASGGSREVATPRPSAAVKAALEAFQQASAPAQQPTKQQIHEAVEKIREVVTPAAQNLQFSVDEELGKTIIRVMDSSTHEVVRQIPSEEVVAISKALDKLQGLLLRQEA